MPGSGVLVDSNYHHTIAWSRALRDHGCNARLAAIHRLVGMGSSQLLEAVIGHNDDKICISREPDNLDSPRCQCVAP